MLWNETWLEPLMDVRDRPEQGAGRQVFGWLDGVGLWVFPIPKTLLRRNGDDVADSLDTEA